MSNVMAALPNVGGALCSRRKVWLTPNTGVPCRTPPLEARSPGRRSNVENARRRRPAIHARYPYTERNFENAPSHPPATGQQRAHTPPTVRIMSSYHGMDASL